MPDRSNLVYRYDGTYQGFLCCVAQCFTDKGLPQAVQRWEEPQATLFPLQGVDTDLDLAQRVERSIRAKASPEALRWVRDGFLSCEAQKELLLIRFVLLGYKYGAKVTGLTVQPDVCALWKTVRAVRNEAHCYLEFLRFSDLGGFLVGELAPKNTVLPLTGCRRRTSCWTTGPTPWASSTGGAGSGSFSTRTASTCPPPGRRSSATGPCGRASTGPSPSRGGETPSSAAA